MPLLALLGPGWLLAARALPHPTHLSGQCDCRLGWVLPTAWHSTQTLSLVLNGGGRSWVGWVPPSAWQQEPRSLTFFSYSFTAHRSCHEGATVATELSANCRLRSTGLNLQETSLACDSRRGRRSHDALLPLQENVPDKELGGCGSARWLT